MGAPTVPHLSGVMRRMEPQPWEKPQRPTLLHTPSRGGGGG